MKDIRSHIRINDIIFGFIERPALKWLAAHTPQWVTPDILTGLGVFGAVITFTSYYLTNFNKAFLWLASLGFFINWLGDSLDGTLARYRDIQRPKYGFFIDHTVDALNEVLIFIGLGTSPFIMFEISSLALIGYLLMSIQVYIRTCVSGEFIISYAGIGPTEMRIIAIIANTVLFFFGNPLVSLPIGSISVFDIIGSLIAGALFIVFIVTTFSFGRELAKIDK